MCIRGNKVSPEQTRQKKTSKKLIVIVEQVPATTEKKNKIFLTATNLKHQRKPVWSKK